ncbi:histone H1.8, partial [Ara ararauna]
MGWKPCDLRKQGTDAALWGTTAVPEVKGASTSQQRTGNWSCVGPGWLPIHPTASAISKLQSQLPAAPKQHTLYSDRPPLPWAPCKALQRALSHLLTTVISSSLTSPAAPGAAGAAKLPGLLAQCRSAPHPSTMQMVIEALQAKDSRKGASAAAIKKFILAKYPTVDPTRLKYWLKVTLSKGLSRGDLVRPHNSTATGAAGTFKLAPKMFKQKQPPGQADPDRGEPPKPAQLGASKPGQAPAAGVRQQGKGLVVPRAPGALAP